MDISHLQCLTIYAIVESSEQLLFYYVLVIKMIEKHLSKLCIMMPMYFTTYSISTQAVPQNCSL
jgi:hypothetical protein